MSQVAGMSARLCSDQVVATVNTRILNDVRLELVFIGASQSRWRASAVSGVVCGAGRRGARAFPPPAGRARWRRGRSRVARRRSRRCSCTRDRRRRRCQPCRCCRPRRPRLPRHCRPRRRCHPRRCCRPCRRSPCRRCRPRRCRSRPPVVKSFFGLSGALFSDAVTQTKIHPVGERNADGHVAAQFGALLTEGTLAARLSTTSGPQAPTLDAL